MAASRNAGGTNLFSRNGLGRDEARVLTDEARKLAALESTIGSAGIDPMLAMLAAELDRAGGRLIPPLFRGGHTRVVLPNGARLSLTAYLETVRWYCLSAARCAE